MPTIQTPEGKVKKAVMDYLWAKGHGCYPHKTVATYDAKIGCYRELSQYAATVGESDLLVFDKNDSTMPIWCELKKPGKRKIDPDQVIFKKQVEDMGHTYIIVNCLEDLYKLGL